MHSRARDSAGGWCSACYADFLRAFGGVGMRWLFACCIGCASALLPGRVPANESPSAADAVAAYRAARIYPVAGPVIERGVLLVQKGKIVGIGPEEQVALPEGAVIHELAGRIVIPGLVDPHPHIGIYPRPSVPA